jgi:hypothetical protein
VSSITKKRRLREQEGISCSFQEYLSSNPLLLEHNSNILDDDDDARTPDFRIKERNQESVRESR